MRRLFLLLVFWGTIPAFFIDPFYGVVHYSLINIIRPEQLLWGGGVGRIFYADQLALLASWFINKERLHFKDFPLSLSMKLLWLLSFEMTIVTFIFALDQDWSWYWSLKFIKLTIFCFLMTKSINSAKKLEQYCTIVIIWWVLLELWGIQQKFGGNVRMEGIGGDQIPEINGFTSIVVLYLPMAYYTIFSRKKRIKLFVGIPAFIISVMFVIYSDSRGGFLGMAACLAFIFIRSRGSQKIKIIFSLVILGALLGLLLSIFAPEGFFDDYKARLLTMLGEEDEASGEVEYEGSAAGRMAIWKAAWHIYKTHPEYWLFGVGMNGFSRMYYQYHIDELAQALDSEDFHHVLFGGHGGKDVHNTYLSVLLGGGAVVFLTWGFLFFYAWFQAHTIPKRYPKIVDGVNIHNYAMAIEAGIIGFSVCMMVGTREFIDFVYWQLMMPGIIINVSEMALKRQEMGLEDEEFEELPVRKFAYTPYFH